MNSWRAVRDLPRDAWWLAAVTLANRAGTMALPFLVLYLTGSAGLAPERAGLLLAVYGAGSLVAAPLSGRLSDRVGPKRVMTASLLVSGALVACYPLADGFGQLAALTLCWSLAADALPPASLALMGALVPAAQRKAAFALNRLSVNLGMSIGPAAGGLLATVSFPALFVVDGATSIVAALLLALAPVREVVARGRPEETPGEGATGGPAGAEPAGAARSGPGALADPAVRLLVGGVFTIALVYYQAYSTLPLYFGRDLGFSEATIGLLFAFSTLLIVAFEVPINVGTSHWSHLRTFVVGALLVAAGFGATGLASTPLAAAATIAVWTFGEIVLFPAFAAFISDAAPEARRGEYMGLYLFAFNAAFGAGPWLGTQIFARLGPGALWAACLGCGLFSAAVLALAARRANTDPPDHPADPC